MFKDKDLNDKLLEYRPIQTALGLSII